MLGVLARLFLVVSLLTGAAFAQDSSGTDYDAWRSFAEQAETTIETGEATNEALDALRSDLADWRAEFLAATDTNATRISTINDQIAALGEPPAEGAEEATEISMRRSELNEQLDTLMVPVRSAEEAYSRADGLIKEIDSLQLDRQAERLFRIGPSPANPKLWPAAVLALRDTVMQAIEEFQSRGANLSNLWNLERLAPLIVLLTFGLILVLKGRAWGVRLTRWFSRRARGDAGQSVSAILVSLFQLLMPMAGLILMVSGLISTDIFGPLGRLTLLGVISIGVGFFSARWLAWQLFPADPIGESLFDLPIESRVKARTYAQAMGTILPFSVYAVQVADLLDYSVATSVVLGYPIMVVAALILGRFGQILRSVGVSSEPIPEDSEGALPPTPFRTIISQALGRMAILVSIAAPLAGLFGYMAAARGIVFPSIVTLGLIGLVVLLSRLVTDLYAVLTRRDDAGRTALVPVLLTFILVMMAVPVLALIWGARMAQITELWERMLQGVSFGGTRISVGDLMTFIVVFVVGIGLTRLAKAALVTSVLPRTQLDRGGQNAAVSGVGYLGILLSVLIAVMAAGINLSSLAVVAGALSLGIGFGLKNIVENFVSGIILLIERPISEGDWIAVDGQMGFVREISVRSTRIETFDRTDVIVPNGDLVSNKVTNYTRGNMIGRVTIKVGVAYGTDTRRIEEILRELIEDQPMVALNPPPQVLFMEFGADSLNFEVRAILRDVTFIVQVLSDMNHAIAQRFKEEGIEIPFAQRDIWLRNPEALSARVEPVPATTLKTRSDAPPERDFEGDGDGDAS